MITASLKNYRISPRKMRVVANIVRGKNVMEAKAILANTSKKARHPISELIDSAVANAKHNFKISDAGLVVKEIRVDQGYVLKRHMPVSRGSAHPIKKKTSHVNIVLAPMVQKGTDKSEKVKTNEKVSEKTDKNNSGRKNNTKSKATK